MAGGGSVLKDRLEGRLGPEKLQERLKALKRETGGLLDGGALLALVADEEGLAETPFSTLSGLEPSRPVFTRCVVERIDLPKGFQGRDRVGRLQKLRVADSSGSLTLTLWDEETGIVEQLGLEPGTPIRILSATLRETRFGREIHVGKTGSIISETTRPDDGPSEPRNIGELGRASGRVDVKGVILSLCTTGRGRQQTTAIRLFDGTGECGLSISHGQLSPPRGLRPGIEIELSGARVVQQEGTASLDLDGRSRLKII